MRANGDMAKVSERNGERSEGAKTVSSLVLQLRQRVHLIPLVFASPKVEYFLFPPFASSIPRPELLFSYPRNESAKEAFPAIPCNTSQTLSPIRAVPQRIT